MTYDCLHNCATYAEPCDTCLDPTLCATEPNLVAGVVQMEILPCLNPYVKVTELAVDPDFKRLIDEELDRAFLFGNGGM